MLLLVLALLFGYLIGSIPTAYIIVKWISNTDIRKMGSGNVGALNSFEVTNSKMVGAAVLIIDLVKGVFATIGAGLLFGSGFIAEASGGVGAVLGHTYPAWLFFKGGRGLATAAGVMFVLSWWFVLGWGIFWFAGFRIFKDVNMGNCIATVLLVLVALLLQAEFLQRFIPGDATVVGFRIFGSLLLGIIVTRLVEPVREYIGVKYQSDRNEA